MKVLSLVLGFSLIVVEPIAGFGQDRPRAVMPTVPNSAPSPISTPENLTRFDLNFVGGPPRELVAAITKASGKHLNVVIPARNADVQIMPIKVENVTAYELFQAIQRASAREVPIVTGTSSGGQKSIQYKSASLTFQATSNPVTDETVWAFISTGPTDEDQAALTAAAEPEKVCQYFQLARYLEDHSVEDITTAIQTGWKMLHIDPVPQLSFHNETKLLIAVGPKDQISLIPQALEQLQLDATAGLEKLAKLQEEVAQIEEKKAGEWQEEARRKREQIEYVARLQRAREAIKLSKPTPPRIINPQ